MNLNKVVLIGRLTRDPEMRTIPSGQTVCNFGMATNRNWTDQSGVKQEATEFHNIVAWRRLAEICGQYLKKGSLVMIEGRLQTRSWQAQDGTNRYRTEIVAEHMQMGPRPAGQGGGSYSPAGASSPTEAASPAPTIQLDEQGNPIEENNPEETVGESDEPVMLADDNLSGSISSSLDGNLGEPPSKIIPF